MTRSSNIGVYLPPNSRYANQYLLRQAEAIGGAVMIGGPRDSTLVSGHWRRIAGGMPTQVENLGRRVGAWRLDPIRRRKLASQMMDVDVVYTMFLPRAVELLEARGSRPGPKIVVHGAGSDITRLASLRSNYRRWSVEAAEAADLVLCGSRFLRERLSSQAPNSESLVHYIGTPIADPPAERPATSRVQVIAVCRLHPVKGVGLVIDSFQRAFGSDRTADLTILGDGPDRPDLEAQIARHGLQGQVRLVGEVGPEAVRRYMEQSDIFVQHNRALRDGSEEALGGSIIEASAAMLPVAATRSGGVEEAVIDGVGGLLCEPGDTDAMAHILRSLAANHGLRQRLGMGGRRYVEHCHNADIQDRRLRNLLVGVVAR